MYVTRYTVQLEPDRPRGIVALCPACVSQERRPHAELPGRAPAALICERCGFDGARARSVTTTAILDDLIHAVDAARAQLAGRPEWLADLDDAYNWLLEFDGCLLTDGHNVLIPSDETPELYYSVNGVCQCGAYLHRANARRDKVCKHRVRARLVTRALERSSARQSAEARSLADRLARARAALAQAEVDELYA